MWRFCNDDIRLLRTSTGKAPKITINELKEKMIEYLEQEGYLEPNEESYRREEDLIFSFIECYFDDEINFDKDLNGIYFGSDNITFDDNSKIIGSIEGFNTLKNGLSILGITICADDEYPLFMCFYWNGKKIRGYLPKYGNTLNLLEKMPFSSQNIALPKKMAKIDSKKFPSFFKNGFSGTRYNADDFFDLFITNNELYKVAVKNYTYGLPYSKLIESKIRSLSKITDSYFIKDLITYLYMVMLPEKEYSLIFGENPDAGEKMDYKAMEKDICNAIQII